MASPSKQHIEGDSRIISSSDPNMVKQIEETQALDGCDVDVRPIFDVVECIFRRVAAPEFHDPMTAHEHDRVGEKITEGTTLEGDRVVEPLALIIQKVTNEIKCKCSGEGDTHAKVMSVVHMLSNYSWDAKVVISLAALALMYGEFWLVVELVAKHPLAKSVAILKHLPYMAQHSNSLKSRLDALNNMIFDMLDGTKRILGFSSPDKPPLANSAHTATAGYWTIKSVVVCATQITDLIGMSTESRTNTSEWETPRMQQLTDTGEMTQFEVYEALVHLFKRPQFDNVRVLKHLIYLKDDIQPLYQASTKIQVPIETLRRKTVLLLISDLEIDSEEMILLDYFQTESRAMQLEYEIVWIPIVDRSTEWNDEHQQKFKQLQLMMPWYTLHQPWLLQPATIKYIKYIWRFQKNMIIVALDPLGNVASPNAFHMMMIWGNTAFPFTAMREKSLWREETWRFELVVDGIDPQLLDWIVQGKHICVYGGQDMQWIRKFTKATRELAQVAAINIELFYVGKSNAKERCMKISSTVQREQLSGSFLDSIMYWYFWTRLECMLYSKMQQKSDVERDHIMREVMSLLSYGGSDEGWATIWHGSNEMARAKGDAMLESFNRYNEWKENTRTKGFVPALREHLQPTQTPHHCTRLVLPGIRGGIPEKVVCAECGRVMEQYLVYRCCNKQS